ncbi:hypothetical protein HPB52_025113 [Rhipicephalus sanguineus]|uniref:Uncharacterized protein n=1 Tax=Rhipicephalus sanguineus TaxID=34632 RepID=A0A9D4TDH0_RHISA|nr:hypothetical protein HPB52_025113 [Rhipicephalus sanguineus]
MDEDSAAFNTVTDATEDDAYNGACWKAVRNKRRARNAAALEVASLLKIDSENPLAKPSPSGTKLLPPLPFRDEKPRPTLATTLWGAAGVSPSDRKNLILRTPARAKPGRNKHPVITRRRRPAAWSHSCHFGLRTYPVSSYLAASDDSCKGIVPGQEPGTTSHTLVEEMQATGIQILQARMMGQTNIAVVTFEGLRVPRFVRFLGAELRCYPHRPRQPVCKTCLKLGHRADYCPTPDLTICEQCGIVLASVLSTENPPTTPASQASPSPYKKALLGKPAPSTATPDHQQPRASDYSNAMAGPREVRFEQGPAQLTPPILHPITHSAPLLHRTPSTDPFPEISAATL